MPLIMVRPGWPSSQFQRTIRVYAGTGKSRKLKSERVVQFSAKAPAEVSDEELAALRDDIGKALFECELDEKARPRLVESAPTPEPRTTEPPPATEK